MKRIRKVTALLLALTLAAAGMTTTAYGATRKKITTVSLKISSNIHVGDEIGSDGVEVETSSSKYNVDDYQFENDGFEWEETDVPKLKVTLKANEDYYFAMTSASSVKLSGAGSKYVSASKQDSSETLVVTMTLSPLKDQAGNITTAEWNNLGQAAWSSAQGSDSYEIRIYKNGSPFGAVRTVTGTSGDFSGLLVRAASYTFRVRGINRYNSENKGEWMESNSIYIDEAAASRFREVGGAQWIQDAVGWWYRNGDGSYTANNWQNINGAWYFFNEQGYMMTGWIPWNNQWYYCNPNGDMAVSTVTPDGYTVDENGVLLQ